MTDYPCRASCLRDSGRPHQFDAVFFAWTMNQRLHGLTSQVPAHEEVVATGTWFSVLDAVR